ncbi:SHOCT domain-containing protein [Sediminicurvatus halobius]|uniref:SHOCT domain-containing protein n=1 Tax=Sediminicurvatus halobius TaxID=2182432 RepID=A0A2U2MYZ8_9GAMM|nr:SHOCT domain-containing protein [Spiribacter halobius]PWG62032.1 hypothetical protein DEM34_13685 [Spiribacter halobius]UEX78708.1 SHOCT domain-containing protein [Spiribacter halobius]
MSVRSLFAGTAATLLLGGCSLLGGGSGDADGPVEATPLTELEVGAGAPPRGSEQLGRYTRTVNARCTSQNERNQAFEEALERLRRAASEDGATYLRVLGTGPLETRGFCDEDIFRLTGLGYRPGLRADSGGGASSEPADDTSSSEGAGRTTTQRDSLTARLEEIEALRERGLITADEYEQLRERVLDQAY